MDQETSKARWKKLTLGIDFFDPGQTPCPEQLRNTCMHMLRDASLDGQRIEQLEDQILSPELTEAEGLEQVSYLEQHRKQLDEYYAPSQRMITAHIKKICGL